MTAIIYNLSDPKLFPASNAVDDSIDTYTIVKYPFVVIIELNTFYIINEVAFVGKRSQFGMKSKNLKIAAMSSLLPYNKIKELYKFIYCGEIKEEHYGRRHQLRCSYPIRIAKFVIFFKSSNDTDYTPFGVNQIEIIGYKYKVLVKKYMGCFRNTKLEVIRKRKTYEECASYCSVHLYLFISFNNLRCICSNDPGFKTNFGNCNVPCKDLKHINCWVKDIPFYPIYMVVYPFYMNTFCPEIIDQFTGNKCPPNVCNSIPGSCNNEGRKCDTYNGGCGHLICKSEIINGFKYADCFPPKGYEMDVHFTVIKTNECETGLNNCTSYETCIVKGDSYECIDKNPGYVKILIVVVIIVLLMVIAFLIYKVLSRKKRKKKKPQPKSILKPPELRRLDSTIKNIEFEWEKTKTSRNMIKPRGYIN